MQTSGPPTLFNPVSSFFSLLFSTHFPATIPDQTQENVKCRLLHRLQPNAAQFVRAALNMFSSALGFPT